jgi:hypothetical protein
MTPYYLGYVEFIHEDLWGRIRPLAIVEKRASDDSWVIYCLCEPDALGATGRVFWPRIPRDQGHLSGHTIRFKVEPNQKARDPDRDLDEFIVAEEWWNGNLRRVAPLGLPLIPEEQVIGPERILALGDRLQPGAIVYRQRLKGTVIDGPWRVGKNGDPPQPCLQPKEYGYVVEHELRRLEPETFLIWDDHDDQRAVLLVEPAKERGRAIDLLPPSGLADWLIRVLRRDKSLLANLESAAPGWMRRVGELLGTTADPIQLDLERGRFERLSAALVALAESEARLADLVELPRFKEILDAAICREIVSARGRIEEAAREETRSIVGRLQQEREQARAQAEREKLALCRQVEQIGAEVAEAERQLAEARAQAQRDEASLRTAAEYLIESRERIIRDFSAFQALIEGRRVSCTAPANGCAISPAGTSGVARGLGGGEVTRMPTIDDQCTFLRDRLAPALASWGTEATRLQAKRLHAALLACRWVAAPCPSWGVAYAEAIGGSARHRVVAVAPTWLSFGDAWAGEVEDFWREAIAARDIFHLLIFADADRALVQCWARPLLDTVSGLRPELPSAVPWTENLRVMTCPSADEAALPVPDWVVSHWAGVKATAGATRPDGPIVPGHVPFSVWRDWAAAPDGVPLPATGRGVAARAAVRERLALTRIFRRLDPDDDPELAAEDARTTREVDARAVFARGGRG